MQDITAVWRQLREKGDIIADENIFADIFTKSRVADVGALK